MIVHTTPPPNWQRIATYLNVDWEKGVVITYGGEIYSSLPSLDPDVIVHEMVHVEQQRGRNMETYLQRYIDDVDFVRAVETPAYRVQAAFIDATETNKARAIAKKRHYAKMMALMYRGAFTLSDASAIMNL